VSQGAGPHFREKGVWLLDGMPCRLALRSKEGRCQEDGQISGVRLDVVRLVASCCCFFGYRVARTSRGVGRGWMFVYMAISREIVTKLLRITLVIMMDAYGADHRWGGGGIGLSGGWLRRKRDFSQVVRYHILDMYLC
jgi:hypothetical protein